MGKKQLFVDSMWPPTLMQVKDYFLTRNMNEREAEHFFAFYQMKQWRTSKGEMMRRWKTAAFGWICYAAIEYSMVDKTIN